MKPNLGKIEDAVLALLYLTSFTEGKDEWRLPGWKGHDRDALDRLHKGPDLRSKKKAKSVVLSRKARNCPSCFVGCFASELL